jgi:hypothetical protein
MVQMVQKKNIYLEMGYQPGGPTSEFIFLMSFHPLIFQYIHIFRLE